MVMLGIRPAVYRPHDDDEQQVDGQCEYHYVASDCDSDGKCQKFTLTADMETEADYQKKSE